MHPAATSVQITFDLPLDPVELSRLSAPERGRIYGDAGLDRLQVAAVEEAVRLVIGRRYGRPGS